MKKNSRMRTIVCPISDQRVDENRVRLNAVLVVLLMVAAFVWNQSAIVFLVAADFYLRGFTKCKVSPVAFLSNHIANATSLSPKLIDKAPKIFAARLGFVMAAVVFILMVLGHSMAAYIVAGVLVFCATLEFAAKICMGCIIYTLLMQKVFTR